MGFMEKGDRSVHIRSRDNHQQPQRYQRSVVIAVICTLLLVFHISTIPGFPLWPSRQRLLVPQETTPFSWNDLQPSKQLKYISCYDRFQCARLDVPLNWNSSIPGAPRAAIAVVRLPAKVPVTDKRYGGAILTNPGGPGESGVHQVLALGENFQTIVDSPSSPSELGTRGGSEKYFDIISFDPRGVNNTTPHLKCFPNAFNQQAWLFGSADYSLLWDSEALLGLEWARSQALGGSCSQEHSEYDMIRHVNTAQVVEDMVAIVESHAEWRQNEAEREITNGQVTDVIEKQDVRDRTAWHVGEEKILYWGLSYGTLLGQTFAAMHPNRVGRLVIDGVVNPTDYYNNVWLENLHDSDKIISKFCDYCFESGSTKCPLYTGNSGRDVEARFEKIVFDLKENPLPVIAEGSRGAEVISLQDLLLKVMTAMCFPYAAAEGLFSLLVEIEAGNATRIADLKQARLEPAIVPVECYKDGPFSDACLTGDYVSGMGANQMIGCMDSAPANSSSLTKNEFKEYVVQLKEQSKWYSPGWSRTKMACVGVRVQPAWSFEGSISGMTSNPLLIIGNTHDTVTPLRNAYHASALFPGSVVLHHESEGHFSMSNPSICTAGAIRKYFQTGQLPAVGTVCNTEYKPFIGCLEKDKNGECSKRSEDGERVWMALRGMTESWA